jgi:hypothetical protein
MMEDSGGLMYKQLRKYINVIVSTALFAAQFIVAGLPNWF